MDIFEDLEILEELEALDEIEPARRPYNTRNRYQHKDNLNDWDDLDFKRRFRLSKASVLNVTRLIEDQLMPLSNRNNPIPALQQVLITLRFYATGSFYVTVGDFANVHKTTAAKIINKVSVALAQLSGVYIDFPITEEERSNVQIGFHRIARFPRVVGAIDCTHIRIQSPGGPNAEVFRNRKGYFSLNIQVICDANYEIRDIVARWPGSSHDANIFDNSRIRMRFENNEMGNGLLLGDSAYPLRSYLITPLQNPRDEGENLFNESQIRTRGVVERTFGIWKRRFPVLSLGMRCKIELAQNIVVATAVLHNIARRGQEELPEINDDIDLGLIAVPIGNHIAQNNNVHVQRELIDYFRTL